MNCEPLFNELLPMFVLLEQPDPVRQFCCRRTSLVNESSGYRPIPDVDQKQFMHDADAGCCFHNRGGTLARGESQRFGMLQRHPLQRTRKALPPSSPMFAIGIVLSRIIRQFLRNFLVPIFREQQLGLNGGGNELCSRQTFLTSPDGIPNREQDRSHYRCYGAYRSSDIPPILIACGVYPSRDRHDHPGDQSTDDYAADKVLVLRTQAFGCYGDHPYFAPSYAKFREATT